MASLASGGAGASKTSAGSTISSKSTGKVEKSSSSSSPSKTTTTTKASSSPVAKGSSGASKTSAKPATSLSSSSSSGSASSGGGSTRSSTVSSRDTNAITPSLSRSLTESSNRTAASSSAEAKAKTAGRNLRGDAQSRAAAADPAVLDQLLTYEALQAAMRGAPREDDEELTLLEQLQSSQTPGAFGNNPMAQDMSQPPAEAPKWLRSMMGLGDAAVRGFMAPGNALSGGYDELTFDPETGRVSMLDPRMIEDAASMAGFVPLGGIPRVGPTRTAAAGGVNAARLPRADNLLDEGLVRRAAAANDGRLLDNTMFENDALNLRGPGPRRAPGPAVDIEQEFARMLAGERGLSASEAAAVLNRSSPSLPGSQRADITPALVAGGAGLMAGRAGLMAALDLLPEAEQTQGSAQRRGPDPSRFTPLGEENLGLSYGMLADMYMPEVDAESGFIRDPDTGTYYRPDLLPTKETRLAEGSAPGLMDAFKPLEDLFDSLEATQRQLNGEAPVDVQPPRRDPRGYSPQGIDAMAIPLPGQTEGGGVIDVTVPYEGESDEARYARENPVPEPKKKTLLDTVVEGGGKLLESTPLGNAVKTLFPDIWYGTGEAIKGIDDGVSYGSGGRSPGTNFEDTANGGSLIEQPVQYAYGGLPFPDANGNGIDDRLEGLAGFNTPAVNWGQRQAQFPNMPPYDPGRSNEWRYFTGPGYAEGGEVEGPEMEGGMQDPRMSLIADAEDVLEDIVEGEPPDAEDAEILKAFVAQFGDDALRALNDRVKAGMKMRPARSREASNPRLVEGPGTETSDSIPAMIDGEQPAALSDGEVVIPADAVRGAGDGDREKGAAQLMALSDMLAAKA